MTYIARNSKMLYKEYQASLADSAELDSDWLDLSTIDKIQITGVSDTAGMTIVISSRDDDSQTALVTAVTYDDGAFYLANIICRQSQMRFQWQNNTGGVVNNVSLAIKGSIGSSDKLSVFPLGVQPSDFSQAALVQSVMRGRNANGDYVNALVNQGGAMVIADFNTEVRLGNVSGYFLDEKFGYIENLGTSIVRANSSTWVDLWFQGGKRTSPTTSFTPYIASDNSGDTSIPISFKYLDASGVKQTGSIVLDGSDGQTPVSLGVTATELTRAWVTGATEPLGIIRVATTNSFTAGVPDNQDEILVAVAGDDDQSQVCADRVPADTKRIIEHIHLYMIRSGGADGSVQAVFQSRTAGHGIWRTRQPVFTGNGAPFSEDIFGITLNAGDDYRIRIRDVSDAGTYVSGNVKYRDISI